MWGNCAREPFLLVRSVGGIVQSRRLPGRPSRRCESSFPAFLSLQVLLDPYFRGRKFFLVVDIIMTLLVIFSVLSSMHRLERSCSDSKSFMTCWDWQIGNLVIRLVIVWALVFWSLWNLNDHFRWKVQEDDIRIPFWRFHQFRKGHFSLVALLTWLPKFSVWVGGIRCFNFKFKD